MKLYTELCSDKQGSFGFDFFVLGGITFSAYATGSTYLSTGNLTIKQEIKSIVLHYDFMNRNVFIYFGQKNLLRKDANYKTDVLASMDFRFDELTIKQHQQLIDFFKKAQNISADCYARYTTRATGRYKVLLNQLQ